MESRWLRMFLFLVVIPVFLGITPKVSSAGELGNSPFFISEVKAFRTQSQADLIQGERTIDDGSMVNRAKQLNLNIIAGTKANTMSDIYLMVDKVADRLVNIQRTTDNEYDPNNRGWPRDLIDSNDKTEAGAPDPDDLLPNNYGTVGMGLLMAYKIDVELVDNTVTPKLDSTYLAAAKKAGDALVERSMADANSLVSTDIIFLYGLSKVCNDTAYKDAGAASLVAFVDSNTPDEVYTYYDTAEGAAGQLKQLKIWQLATWVEAAKLYASDGDSTAADLNAWADGLMGKIITCQCPAGGFYYEKTTDNKYYVRTAGHAKVLEVIKRFYPETYKDNLKNGLAYLKALQYDKAYVTTDNPTMRGAFYCGGYTTGTTTTNTLTPWNKVALQDQCYGIQAMAYNFQTTWKKRDNYKSTYWAANYLIKSMTAVGPEDLDAFVDRVNFDPASSIATYAAIPRTDRNSEAIQALYYSCKEGDVTRSGNIIACNALEVLKASIGKRISVLSQLNGPEIVAADRNNDNVINNQDIEAILSDAVGDHQPIHSFLEN